MAKKKPVSILTPDHAVKAFIKLLESGGHSRSIREKFSDFLELAYCAVAKTTALTQERADDLEERYMKVVKKYRDDEIEMVKETYPHMLAVAVMALQWGGIDFLGHVAAELSALDSGLGQFFTPYEVSKMMAAMTFSDVAPAIIRRDGYITLCEPAAGAGGMVLAYADALEAQGFDPAIHMLVQAIDVSYVAYQMCFLQLAWRGVAAQVIRGNSLSLQTFESAWTPAALFRFHAQHGHCRFDKPPRAYTGTRAISPVGERRTIKEATFRRIHTPVLVEATNIVEAEFERLPVTEVPDGQYEQMALF